MRQCWINSCRNNVTRITTTNNVQPFDDAWATTRVDTVRARVPAPIELNMHLQRRNQPVLLVGVSQRSGQGSQVETQADTRQLLEKSQGKYFP